MTSKTWAAGTVIDSAWLQDVDDTVYGLPSSEAGKGASLVRLNTNETVSQRLSKEGWLTAYLPDNYVTDGSVDYTTQIQAALDVWPTVILPHGIFKHTRLIQKFQNQTIVGQGRGHSVLYCPTGPAITNYAGAENDPIGPDWFGGLTLRDLTLRGGFNHTDVFDPPTNSWAVATGRSKALTTSNINSGLRLKRCYPYTLERVDIEHFHRGVYASGAALARWENFEISNCQVGMWGESGASWGDSAWQVTTHHWRDGRFHKCWIGIGGYDFVQCQVYKRTVDFEPCNSGIAITNGGENTWGGYFELCCEGIYRNGSFMGHDVIEDPFFGGSPGAYWGNGDSILLDSGIGSTGRVTLRNGGATVTGGGIRVLGGRFTRPELASTGTLVYLSTAITPSAGVATTLSWSLLSTSDDAYGLYSSSAPTKLTIPTQLSGCRVRLHVSLSIAGDASANDVTVQMLRNGASFPGQGKFAEVYSYGRTIRMSSAPVTVVSGQEFSVSVLMSLSRLIGTSDASWMTLEVVE